MHTVEERIREIPMLTVQSRLQKESNSKALDQLSVDQQIDLLLYAGSWVNRGVFTPTANQEQFQLLGSCEHIPQRAADLLRCEDGPLLLKVADQISRAAQLLQLSATGFMKDALNEVNGIYAIATLLAEEPILELVNGLKEDAEQLQAYQERVARSLLSNQCIERLVSECGLSTTLEQVISLTNEQERQIFDQLVSDIRQVTSAIDSDALSNPEVRAQAETIMEITHTLQRMVGTDPEYHIKQSRYGELDLVYSNQDIDHDVFIFDRSKYSSETKRKKGS